MTYTFTPEKLAVSTETSPVEEERRVCWPWRLRHLADEAQRRFVRHPKGGNCTRCRRDVAVYGPGQPICIYCNIDDGVTEDQPLAGCTP